MPRATMPPAEQLSLHLPAPPAAGEMPLVPARMVNEWVYCPRLAYLEWVEGEWGESGDTADGRRVHARVDRGGGRLSPPGAEAEAGAEVEAAPSEAGGGASAVEDPAFDPAAADPAAADPATVEARGATEQGPVAGSASEGEPESAAGDDPEAAAALAKAGLGGTARSVSLSSERLGLIAKLDLVEAGPDGVLVVDYKRGKRPHTAAGAHDPERVQLCAQALLLEENGYRVAGAAIWYAASRERVPVALDEGLRAQTLRAVSELRLAAEGRRRPPPLEGSPKCVRCSLAGICLPDELTFFRRRHPPRPLNPAADPALPLYVQQPGARVRKSGERLVVEAEEGRTEVPLTAVSEVCLFGPVNLTTPALHALFREEIPVAWFSSGGWLLGHSHGTGGRGGALREAQFRVMLDERACLHLARGLVAAKIRNQRTLLRRNWRAGRGEAEKPAVLEAMAQLARRAEQAPSAQVLLGFEGEGAALYFRHLTRMLAPATAERFADFAFEKRNRRPPTDPVNALLSFGYALLLRSHLAVLLSVGFDAWRGFYHRPRPGRPALALDAMEPFRPLLVDSVALAALNNGEIGPEGFLYHGPECALKPAARRAFIAAYERRLQQETTHPLFGYRLELRRLLAVQARLLARFLQGEIPEWPHYQPR